MLQSEIYIQDYKVGRSTSMGHINPSKYSWLPTSTALIMVMMFECLSVLMFYRPHLTMRAIIMMILHALLFATFWWRQGFAYEEIGVCVVKTFGDFADCTPGIPSFSSFSGFDVDLFRFVALQAGWADVTGVTATTPVSAASGNSTTFRLICTNVSASQIVAYVGAPAGSECNMAIGTVNHQQGVITNSSQSVKQYLLLLL